jgi:hypothetical protein
MSAVADLMKKGLSRSRLPEVSLGSDPDHPAQVKPLTTDEFIAKVKGVLSDEEADRLEAAIAESCTGIDASPA